MSAPLGYVRGLDGLRTLAVATVVLLHSGATWAEGGGLGVNVFFVLSGFLITSLLLSEWDASESIAIGRFYLQRFLRLMPALLLLLGGTVLVSATGILDLPPKFDLDELAGPIALSATYLSDVAIAYTDSDVGPFFHTWSLAIEEHFYLVWPPLLMMMLRAGWSRRRLAAILIGGIAVVTVWRGILGLQGHSAARLLYAPDTQADHLMWGCLLAVLWPEVRRRVEDRTTALTAAAAGAIVVFLAMVVADPSNKLLAAGGYTVVAVAAAVLITAAATGAFRGPLRVLESAPVTYLGRLSYGIYLWHFTVFVALTNQMLGMSHTPRVLVRVAVSVALAAASYHLMERRITAWRRRHRPSRVSAP